MTCATQSHHTLHTIICSLRPGRGLAWIIVPHLGAVGLYWVGGAVAAVGRQGRGGGGADLQREVHREDRRAGMRSIGMHCRDACRLDRRTHSFPLNSCHPASPVTLCCCSPSHGSFPALRSFSPPPTQEGSGRITRPLYSCPESTNCCRPTSQV